MVENHKVKCPWERIGRDDDEFYRTYCIYKNRVVCFGKLSCDEYNEWLEARTTPHNSNTQKEGI